MQRVRPAPIQLTNHGDSHNQGRSILVSWFPQWWGWHSSPQNAQTEADKVANNESTVMNGSTAVHSPSTENSVTVTSLNRIDQGGTEWEGEILDALADSVENNTILRRDTVFGQFNFSLKKGSINLSESHPEKLVYF